MEQLKPCPFCGSESIIISNWGMWRCWCQNCRAKAEDSLSRKEAIEAWNRRADGWISVEDRLPDVNKTKSGYEHVMVIAATKGGKVRAMLYERACPRGKTAYRWKFVWDRIYNGDPVTHWMPLPDPPKGEPEK